MPITQEFFAEFKEFVNRGNVMDLAVAVIIGGAFTGIVTALTANIINPLAVVVGGGAGAVSGLVVSGTDIDFGAFISACINFLIVALVVFCLVKAINKAQEVGSKLAGKGSQEEEPKPVATCPFCPEEVKEGAALWPHCAGEFVEPAKAK